MAEPKHAEAIYEGKFLGDRYDNGNVVQLYGLTNFYAEITYDPIANKVTACRAFDGIQQLTPYLAHTKFNPR